jgi:nucleotide-binding universal stress UspA family protein
MPRQYEQQQGDADVKILIPVDGSAHADAALDFVASRTTLLGRDPEIRLLNVQPPVSARVVRAFGRVETRAYQRAQADEVLRPALARLERAGVVAKASYSLGQRADAIGAMAVRSRSDLIVMGSRGHSALKGLLFGSMTSAVLASCAKPLLVLRSGTPPKRDTLLVGIAVDGSAFSLAAARWVLQHAELFGAAPRFQLIHVLDPSARKTTRVTEVAPPPGIAYSEVPMAGDVGDGGANAAAIDKIVAPVRKLFTKAGVEPETVRLLGDNPGDAIVAHARKRRIDVLVMGSHGRGAFDSLVLGSVAMRVAARCDKPLLLIREK